MPESQDHILAKERIRDIVRSEGYIAEVEVPFWCWSEYHSRIICYSADIFIWSPNGGTIVEVDGFKGHLSKYQYRRDERRTKDIKAMWGDNLHVRRYTLSELEIATDEEIKRDLELE